MSYLYQILGIISMASVGAPIGNQNATKALQFRQAILNCIDEHPEGRMAGLQAIVAPHILKAMDGCLESARFIVERIDGKANQQVNVDSTLAISVDSDRPRLTPQQWLAEHGVNSDSIVITVDNAKEIKELTVIETVEVVDNDPTPAESERPL